MKRLLTILFIFLLASQVNAQDFLSNDELSDLSTPEFLPVEEAYQVDASFHADILKLTWLAQEGYYLYGEQFQVQAKYNGELLQLEPERAPGVVQYDEIFEREVEVYYEQVDLSFLVPSTGLLELIVQSQGCADAGLCYPPYALQTSIDLDNRQIGQWQVVEALPLIEANDGASKVATSTESVHSVWWALLFALLGGIILNAMPCVFPVLSIKALSIVQHSGPKAWVHGLAYTFGVVTSFVAIAALLLVLKASGEAIGWGFQLQQPLVVLSLAFLLFAVGLNLTGVYTLGTRLMSVGDNAQHPGLFGSVMTGVLATLVASPCTAPFMGAALGYAITQDAFTALMVFAVLGFGLALPLLLLTLFPKVQKWLPAPGHWMETLKQWLAFPVYITVVWLLWVLGHQAGVNAMGLAALGCVLLAALLWVLGQRQSGQFRKGWLFAVVLLVGLVGFVAIYRSPLLSVSQAVVHEESSYSEEYLNSLLEEGEAVFIDATAAWCITCLANKRVALNDTKVQAAFEEKGVHFLVADWTNRDAEITELLSRYGRSGVPLYLYFAPGSREAKILPQLLTPEIVISYLSENG